MIRAFLNNKKRILFAVACIAFVVVTALSLAGTFAMPKAETLVPPAGGTAKSIVRSYTDDNWYLGDSEGNVIRMSPSEEENYVFPLPSGASVSMLYSDSDLDYVVALDDRLNLYGIRFGEEGAEIVAQGTISGGCYGLTADENYVYVLTTRSRSTAFRKYSKYDFNEVLARGLLYTSTYLPSAHSWTLSPINNAKVILFEAVGDYLYVLTEGGAGYRISNSFEMNAFDWMSGSELDKYGATIDKDGTVTVPEENFDEEKYFGKRFSYTSYAAVYDQARERMYVAYANRRLYIVDADLNEESWVPISDIPGEAMYLHEESGTLYFNYNTISDVGVCDVAGEELSVSARAGDFDISDFMVAADGEDIYYLYSNRIGDAADSGSKILKKYDRNTWAMRGTVMILTVIGYCLSAVFLIVAVVTGIFSLKPQRVTRARTLMRTVRKSWVTYLIVFLSLGSLVLFTYYPGFSSLFISFFEYTKARPTFQWNNFANYAAVFTNPYVGVYFRNLIIFLVSDIFLTLLPPIIFAVCLVFIRNKKFSTLCRILLYIPGIIPSIAATLIWTNGIYGLDGLLNAIISACGGKPTVFLQQENMSVFWLLMMGFPFVGSYLIFYGGLMNVPASYYEAAELDGCSVIKRIFLIDIPLITPQIKYVFVMSFISSVQNFTRVRLTTDGLYGSQVIMNVLYNYLSEGEYGISSAYGAIMFVILMVATLINLRLKTVDAEG